MKRKLPYFLAALLFTGAPVTAQTQQRSGQNASQATAKATIEGTVVRADNGQPLKGARVMIQPAGSRAQAPLIAGAAVAESRLANLAFAIATVTTDGQPRPPLVQGLRQRHAALSAQDDRARPFELRLPDRSAYAIGGAGEPAFTVQIVTDKGLAAMSAFDERAVAVAIRRELLREGLVFFVHNRVQYIEHVARGLKELVPEARVAVAHCQMDEGTLERVVIDSFRDAIEGNAGSFDNYLTLEIEDCDLRAYCVTVALFAVGTSAGTKSLHITDTKLRNQDKTTNASSHLIYVHPHVNLRCVGVEFEPPENPPP